ncbi:MAG: (E)-4-hydroxy-3-methylbut-2-enyl-diphosphate synthase [Verrucomicrobiota bacterium]
MSPRYCHSRFQTVRWETREVQVGGVGIGGSNPIRVQSMTTTDTCDVVATVRQTIELAEAGCEIVRITAPTMKAGEALKEIRAELRRAKVTVPLVADIHFLPKVAMEAVNHVDKVRINPGNYADRKAFKIREYSDDQYDEEMERLYDAFSPIVLRSKELGKAMRIGTNHGSLSDRIMNRYGDTPNGMVESALEFIRIAESHNFHDIILSMKASNPKVMIEAYRLAAARMHELGMQYPLHLGVTEAGDGEDARIKSTIGIGSLLYDGLGDTIRVSLTEDPIHEVPVARDLARRASILRENKSDSLTKERDSIDPFEYTRRPAQVLALSPSPMKVSIGGSEAPAVCLAPTQPLSNTQSIIQAVCRTQLHFQDSKIEGVLLSVCSPSDLNHVEAIFTALRSVIPFFVLEAPAESLDDIFADWKRPSGSNGWIISTTIDSADGFQRTASLATSFATKLAAKATPSVWRETIIPQLSPKPDLPLIASLQWDADTSVHPLGQYRLLAETLKQAEINAPLWIRLGDATHIEASAYFGGQLIEASLLAGPLLADGLGDMISVHDLPELKQANGLAYNILQAARSRISKTEYVACPSCGRTLFDLQSTTARVKDKTAHLKGVTIAVMGCIVNGPGEMADADFGYVGGAPGKINLYVGKKVVKAGIPQDEAVDRLVDLIKQHGKWVDPKPVPATE